MLTAFQNVADALRAIETDADGLVAAAAAERAAATSLDIARRQFAIGVVNYLALPAPLPAAEAQERKAPVSELAASVGRKPQ